MKLNKLIAAAFVSGALLVISNTALAKPADCKVNINTANEVQLVNCLDRVGNKLAIAIMKWRDEMKGKDEKFLITGIDQLIGKVPRFGKKTAELNTAKVCFDDECTKDAPKAPPVEKGEDFHNNNEENNTDR